jgi:hypothetical protein
MDMNPSVPKAVWGFNGTERPGAVYLAAVLAATLVSLASVSDNSYLPSFLALVRNLGLSYGSAVLILHGLLNLFSRGKGFYGWLFVPIVGSAFYAGVVSWYSVQHDLRFEHSLGWVLMQGVGAFVGSTGVGIFLSLPISAWFHRNAPLAPDLATQKEVAHK